VVDFLKQRNWPGNVRELENLIERLVTLVPAELVEISRNALPIEIRSELAGKTARLEETASELSFADRLTAYEADLISQSLEANGWNQSRAARALKMPVQTLHNKMVKLKIDRPDSAGNPHPGRL
jgi:DNA-binding NtrC family response regulator